MRGPHGPQTQVQEGACAIKVSMSCSYVEDRVIYYGHSRTDQVYFRAGLYVLMGGEDADRVGVGLSAGVFFIHNQHTQYSICK